MQIAAIGSLKIMVNGWFVLLLLAFAALGLGVKAALVVSAVLLHELAHIWTARQLGFIVRECELLPFGGVARLEEGGLLAPAQEALVAAAGPLASFLIAALAYAAGSIGLLEKVYCDFYVRTNLMLALFNLLPGLPLDGGRLVRAALAPQLTYAAATRLASGLGRVVAAGLAAAAGYEGLVHHTVNITFLVMAGVVAAAAREPAVAGGRSLRILAGRQRQLLQRGMMPAAYFVVEEGVRVREVLPLFQPHRSAWLLVVDRNMHLKGSVSEIKIWEQLPQKGLYAKIGEFI